jgi:hypothetical protein
MTLDLDGLTQRDPPHLPPRSLLAPPQWGSRCLTMGEALKMRPWRTLGLRWAAWATTLFWRCLKGRVETSSSTFLLVWKSSVLCLRCPAQSRSGAEEVGVAGGHRTEEANTAGMARETLSASDLDAWMRRRPTCGVCVGSWRLPIRHWRSYAGA